MRKGLRSCRGDFACLLHLCDGRDLTHFEASTAQRHPAIGVVGMLDVQDHNIVSRLEWYGADEVTKGFRSVPGESKGRRSGSDVLGEQRAYILGRSLPFWVWVRIVERLVDESSESLVHE